MRKFVFLIMALIAPVSWGQEDESEKSNITEAARSVVSSVVRFGKDVISGVSDGVTEGRKSGESEDGAVIVSNLEELDTSIEVKILNKYSDGEKAVRVEVGFQNNAGKPARIINLREKNAVLIVDDEGFVTGATIVSGGSLDITIPENAAIKHSFYFNVPVDQATALRLWGREYKL